MERVPRSAQLSCAPSGNDNLRQPFSRREGARGVGDAFVVPRRKTMRAKRIALATLGVTAALLCTAAYAQDSKYQDRAANDAAMPMQQTSQARPATSAMRQKQAATATSRRTAAAATPAPSASMGAPPTEAPKYRTGPSLNDNGMVTVQAQNQGQAQPNSPGFRSGGSIGGGYYNSAAGWGTGPTTAAMESRDNAGCQIRFRSFDPASRTFLGFDGVRHPCP
jgi:hypothetical protein